MSGDVLSQAEVENLLSAMDGDAPPEGAPVEVDGPARPKEKITVYDFKRPERVGKEQMRALQTMHEGFGRNFGAALSALIRSIVEVKLTSVDQLTYSEFVFSLENPTCFNLISAPPLEGQLIVDINPSVLYRVIDRLLGGKSEGAAPVRRALTEIELRLASRVTDLFLREMTHAWENVLVLDPKVDHVESNPQLVQIIPANEVVVLISFELTISETRGMINLCIPFNSIESIANKLTSNSWISYSSRPATAESIQGVSQKISDASVELVAEVAETKITTADLIGLQVGDVIATEKDIHEPMRLMVEGRPKFLAKPGQYKGRKALEVVSYVPQTPTVNTGPVESSPAVAPPDPQAPTPEPQVQAAG